MFAFYNSFLKIELNCEKENHVNFKYTCSFQKMLSDLTFALIYQKNIRGGIYS